MSCYLNKSFESPCQEPSRYIWVTKHLFDLLGIFLSDEKKFVQHLTLSFFSKSKYQASIVFQPEAPLLHRHTSVLLLCLICMTVFQGRKLPHRCNLVSFVSGVEGAFKFNVLQANGPLHFLNIFYLQTKPTLYSLHYNNNLYINVTSVKVFKREIHKVKSRNY